MPENDLILVQVSFAEQAPAEKTAALLIEQCLAACVQVAGPVVSTYRWKNQLQREEEYILTVKTLAGHYPKLAAFITEHHPYEVPEIIAIPVHAVNDAYLNWARQQCV